MSSISTKNDYIPAPDRSKFRQEMDALRLELRKVKAEIVDHRAKIDQQRSVGMKSPEEEKVRAVHNEVLQSLQKLRQEEQSVRAKAAELERPVKEKILQLQKLRPKGGNLPRTQDELEKRVSKIELAVESGQLSLVEEAKALREVRQLRNMRSSFSTASKLQEEIDEARAKAALIRDKFDQSALKKAVARKQELELELEGFKSSRSDKKSVLDGLFTELRQKQARVKEITTSLDAKRAEFEAKQQEFAEKLKERKAARAEEEKKEKELRAREKRIEAAREKLAAARVPAFQSNISSAHALLHELDPTHEIPDVNAKPASSTPSTASLNRPKQTTETPVVAKPAPTASVPPSRKSLKQKKKGDKQKDAGLKVDLGLVEALSALNIAFPRNPEEVEETKKQLLEKIKYYEENNQRVTEEKVKRAEAELEEALKE